MLVTGRRAADRRDLFSDLSLVTFNYDRCAETALFHLVRQAYAIEDVEAVPIMEGLKVYRPYGGLGALPWMPAPHSPFGPEHPDTLTMASGISIYTEELGERPDLVEMQGMLQAASNIVFLGFGFHKQNMELISPEAGPSNPPRVLATMYGEPDPVVQVVTARIHSAYGVQANIHLGYRPVDSTQFIREHGVLLSA